jgi:hypothetical protein
VLCMAIVALPREAGVPLPLLLAAYHGVVGSGPRAVYYAARRRARHWRGWHLLRVHSTVVAHPDHTESLRHPHTFADLQGVSYRMRAEHGLMPLGDAETVSYLGQSAGPSLRLGRRHGGHAGDAGLAAGLRRV